MTGSTPELHKKDTSRPYAFALITVSTSRFEKYGSISSPDEADDISGKIMLDELLSHGNKVVFYRLVPDEKGAISDAFGSALESEAEVVLISGGTGLTTKDLTIESVQPLFEKEIPGFGELFRSKSLAQIGTSAILTRAVAGVINKKAVFCLPGSPNAVKLALFEIILPEAGHIVRHVGE